MSRLREQGHREEKRGFLGRAGIERRLNLGCLVVILGLAVLFLIARAVLAPGDLGGTDPTKQTSPR